MTSSSPRTSIITVSWLLLGLIGATASSDAGDFEALFDGTTLSGWHTTPGGSWTVEDGKIVGRSPASERRHGLLVSDRSFTDFEARARFRVLAGDSGFYFRVAIEQGNNVAAKGFQVEIDSSSETGGLYETGGRGWVKKPDATRMQEVYRPGEWSTLHLLARGRFIEVRINGVRTARLKRDKGRLEGPIALQLHGGMEMHVEWQQIEVRELKKGDPVPGRRPNVVWILAEDIGPDLSCYGCPAVETPNLDQFAAQGSRFLRAFTTSPVCSTSRSAMITGRHQSSIGAHQHRTRPRNPLPDGVETLPQLLSKAGWYCALGCGYSSKTDFNFKTAPSLFDGKDWSGRAEGQPFFAQITIGNTHRSWKGDPQNPVDPAKVEIPPYYPDEPLVRADWALGLGEIQVMDRKVGKILERLDREGLADDTVVVFIGDNGRCHPRGKQFLYDGGVHVPLIIRWPDTIGPATVRAELASTIDITATILEIAGVAVPDGMQGRSLLDATMPARNAVFASRGKMDATHDAMTMMRTATHKYILNRMPERPWCQFNNYKEMQYPTLALLQLRALEGKLTPQQAQFVAASKPPEELYDLRSDPHELHNLATDPAQADLLLAMRSATGQFSKRVGDEDPDETWRAGGWPATYPTRSIEDWRRIVEEWSAHLLEGAELPLIVPMTGTDPRQSLQISDYVREVFQDRDGVLWFGTNGDGVCRYDAKSLPLPPLSYLSVEQGFGGQAVRGIVQHPDGAIWFATDGGVSRFEDGKFTNYTEDHGLSDNQVWSLMCDSAGTIWAGTHGGVCRFDGESFVPFPLPRVEIENPESRFSPLVSFAIFEDPTGNIWFGTDGEGVHRYDGESFTSYTMKEGLAGNVVRCIEGDRHGGIWIGTNGGGASRYDGQKFRTFTSRDGLSNDRVYEILEDSRGDLWFSTLGAGICRYDGTSFTAFGVDQGLKNLHPLAGNPANIHVQEFFEDSDGILWLGCSGGLFRMDGESFIHVTRNGPWPAPSTARASNPMASFERMVPGQWQVTYQSGTSMFDRWIWGPGQHSMRVETDGSGAAGEPWRALQLFYWHPGRQQVCLLGLSPFARGVSEGTMRFEGEIADAVFDLYQTPGLRKMSLHWDFDGRDRYFETLLEASGSSEYSLLNGPLKYNRIRTLTPSAERTDVEAPKPSKQMEALEALVGHTWQTKGGWTGGDAFHLQTTFEWIPYADYIHGRTFALTPGAEPMILFDLFLYHHTGTDTLRCLALSKWGGVHEGDLTVQDSGALQLDLESHEGDQVVEQVMRFQFEEDGSLRHRIGSVDGAEDTPLLDVHHRKVQHRKLVPNQD